MATRVGRTGINAVEAAAQRFHALADPTRLRILMQLAGGERCVCELTGELGAAQSRLSFHLRTLKEAGLVRDRRAGRWVYYAVSDEVLAEMSAMLSEAASGRWPDRGLPVPGGAAGCCAPAE